MTTNRTVTSPEFDAVIYYPGIGLISGRVRDISDESMFIDTGSLILHSDMPVEVALAAPGGDRNTLYRLQARVTGSSRQGVELRFHDLTPRMQHSLRKIVQEYVPTDYRDMPQPMGERPA